MTRDSLATLTLTLGLPVLFAVLFYINTQIKNSYTRTALVAGLAMPLLVSVVFHLGSLIVYPYVRGETPWIYPFILRWGPAMLFSLCAGWWLMSGRRLPPTLKERYIPLLLLPTLLYLMVVSFFPSKHNPKLGIWLAEAVRYGLAWLMFVLGVCLGARKNAPALERRQGTVRMLAYIGLTCVVIGANLFGIVSNTLYGPRDNLGKTILTWEYGPTSDLVAKPAGQPSLRISDNYPTIYGHTELLPLYGAIIQAVYAPGNSEDSESFRRTLRDLVKNSTLTRWSVSDLMKGQFEVLFDDLPTIQSFLARSEEAETPEITLIAHDALVFFVHKDNPVTDLSLAQLKDIYAGNIRFWNSVGGRLARILAFQPIEVRVRDTLSSKVMHDQRTMRPLMEEFSDNFPSFTHQVAEYRNRPNALGYASFWEARQLFPAGEIRFLRVNGVAPSPENIRNGTYPLAFPIAMATRPSPRKEVKELRDWICSPEGQDLIERAGFVSLEQKAAEPEESRPAQQVSPGLCFDVTPLSSETR